MSLFCFEIAGHLGLMRSAARLLVTKIDTTFEYHSTLTFGS